MDNRVRSATPPGPGVLTVRQADDGRITMDFPAQPPVARPTPPPGLSGRAWGPTSRWCGIGGGDYLVELVDAATVRQLQPDLAVLGALPARGFIVTAAGRRAESGTADATAASISCPVSSDRRSACRRIRSPAAPTPSSARTGPASSAEASWSGNSFRPGAAGSRSGSAADRVELTGQAVTVVDGSIEWDERRMSAGPLAGVLVVDLSRALGRAARGHDAGRPRALG